MKPLVQTFSFDTDVAKKYGVDEAIMLKNISFWIAKNKANNKNLHDGYYWTFNSKRALSFLFPFWTEKQIRRIIGSLKTKGAIKTGNYNKSKYDRTQWYTIIDSTILNATKDKKPSAQMGQSNGPNRPIKRPKQTDQTVKKGQPIPDINTDINTNENTDNRLFSKILKYWNSKDIIKHRDSYISKFKKKHKDLIKELGLKQIGNAIKNYNIILKNPSKYWFTYKFELIRFLEKIETFLDSASPLTNYKKQNTFKTNSSKKNKFNEIYKTIGDKDFSDSWIEGQKILEQYAED